MYVIRLVHSSTVQCVVCNTACCLVLALLRTGFTKYLQTKLSQLDANLKLTSDSFDYNNIYDNKGTQ